MSAVARSGEATFAFDVLRAEGPVVVDFYADWCSQCRRLAPVLDELAADWGDRVKVVKVDVERHPHLADRYEIRRIPTLIAFSNGEEVARLVEVVRRPAVEDGLAHVIDHRAPAGEPR